MMMSYDIAGRGEFMSMAEYSNGTRDTLFVGHSELLTWYRLDTLST